MVCLVFVLFPVVSVPWVVIEFFLFLLRFWRSRSCGWLSLPLSASLAWRQCLCFLREYALTLRKPVLYPLETGFSVIDNPSPLVRDNVGDNSSPLVRDNVGVCSHVGFYVAFLGFFGDVVSSVKPSSTTICARPRKIVFERVKGDRPVCVLGKDVTLDMVTGFCFNSCMRRINRLSKRPILGAWSRFSRAQSVACEFRPVD